MIDKIHGDNGKALKAEAEKYRVDTMGNKEYQ